MNYTVIRTIQKTYFYKSETIDVYGIDRTCNVGIYSGDKDIIYCISIGPDLHQNAKCPVIRERNFILIPFFVEEFGPSKTSHL